MKELVSVIILAYKNVNGIYDSLNSVFSQKYENIEVIVSDDGSPGFTEHISAIEDYCKKNAGSNVKNVLVNAIKENAGTVRNINSAIDLTTGKYIKVLSADDTFSHENAIEHYVDFMEKNDYKIAFAKLRGITPDGEYKYELLSCETDYKLLKSYSVEDTRKRLYKRNFLPAPAWIIDRSLFEENGLFIEDTRLIEDYSYWIHLTMKGVKFGYIEEFLIDYKLSGVSSAGNYSEMFMNDMLVIYDKYIFPYDRRFGIFQPIYNSLKKAGLNFYMAEAKRGKMSKKQRLLARIKYFPFGCL